MFNFKNLFANNAANNNNVKEDNEMKNINMTNLMDSVSKLTKSVTMGLTFNGDAYRYADLMAEADNISADIISQVFAITNIASRLTGLVGIQSAVATAMSGLSDKPTMGDIKTMFDNINLVFGQEYKLAKASQDAESLNVLRQLVGGRSVFTMAYVGINALYGRVCKTVGKHMPHVELKNQILVNFSKAIHTVATTLRNGFKLVMRGLKAGLSFAAALLIQCGRVITHIIRSAVELVTAHLPKRQVVAEELEYDEAAMEAAMEEMSARMAQGMGKTVSVYQAATQEAFEANMMALLTKKFSDEMTLMFTCQMEGESDEDILDACFERGNDGTWASLLKYSLSVGDIVDIEGRKYRCMPEGWQVIEG